MYALEKWRIFFGNFLPNYFNHVAIGKKSKTDNKQKEGSFVFSKHLSGIDVGTNL